MVVILFLVAILWKVFEFVSPGTAKLVWQKLKRFLLYVYLKLLKRRQKPMFNFVADSTEVDEVGVTSPADSWLKENPRQLSADDSAVDSLHLWGCDQSGNVLMLNVCRRPGRKADTYMYIRLENGEEYQLPNQPDSRVCNTDGKSFGVRGLSVEVLEPLRIWRVNFHGTLRKGIKNEWNTDEIETVPVHLNAIWHPMYNYSAYPIDFNVNLMSDLLSKRQWTRSLLKDFQISSTEWHEQWGQLHGILKVEHKEYRLLVTGTKFREHGIQKWASGDRKLTIKGLSSIALGFQVYATSHDNDQVEVFHAEVAPPSNEKIYFAKKCRISDVETLFSDADQGKEVHIQLTTDFKQYNVTLKRVLGCFNVFVGDNWEQRGRISMVEMTINGKKGVGFVETYQGWDQGCPVPRRESLPLLSEPADVDMEQLVVSLRDVSCQSSKNVGGKGSSLALMIRVKDEIGQFQIPNGLCLTKRAFELHLIANPLILQAISDLQQVAWKNTLGKLDEECKRVAELIKKSSIYTELLNDLRDKLKETFGDDVEDLKFAVRSSAIGEDGEELSAAGQNDTFLGVKGFEKICDAILKCWASQFSFQSVEYKRQNGQLINAGMGVVIQQMVAADVAGVLFTKDPLTESMDTITITANYGLGESVVSAAVNPDTILIQRTWNDAVRVVEKMIGKKESKITMAETGDGTVETCTNADEASRCTISNEVARKLAEIAILLEKYFGNSRDVEWAISNGNIYVLQARPVTSGAALTDFDVHHEFDVCLKTSDEQFSRGNVGEVMPGALSTLSMTSNVRAQGIFFLRTFIYKMKKFRYDPSVMDGGAIFFSHVFFDLVQQKVSDPSGKKNVITKATEVGLYGRVLDDEGATKVAKERFEKPSFRVKMFMARIMFPGMIRGSKVVEKMEREWGSYPIPGETARTAKEAYREISKHLLDVGPALVQHLYVTFASMMWNTLILVLLSGGNSDFNQDHYSDFASLIGSSLGAESGDVPLCLKEVAAAITREMDGQEFARLSPQDALSWLTTKASGASAKFRDFIKKHGHRGVKEFDVISTTWGMNPISIVKILQAMSKAPLLSGSKRATSVAESTKAMKTDMSSVKKKLLEWLVHRSRNGVCYRERAKSLLIYQTHQTRLAMGRLGKLLVAEGYIPDEGFVFFMTFEEIGQLLDTRSPRLVMRARCRRRLYKEMDEWKFPEISTGFPVPMSSGENDFVADGETQATGLPVCYGVVKGMARVVTSFSEVDTIQSGEILITQATDIGWSPYFPILAGVVTEIGGLVSHGAVVAREYGLPCIIGAENATKIFKSGDTVLLDATNGKIMKLKD